MAVHADLVAGSIGPTLQQFQPYVEGLVLSQPVRYEKQQQKQQTSE